MKIEILPLLKSNGNSLTLDLEGYIHDEWFEENGYSFEEPTRFKGNITNNAGVLSLSGKLEVRYVVLCYRCLKKVSSSSIIELEEVFINERTQEKQEDQYVYKGDFLELDEVFKDNFILSLPMKHLCEEECKGLCIECGANLNDNTCSCILDEVDPRLEELKKLLDNKQQ